jgi:pimeloyl-ACP methyl ester carboxylesterase
MDYRITEVLSSDADKIRAIIEEDTRSQLAGADVDFAAIVEERLAAIGDARGYVNGARAIRHMHDEPLNPRLDMIVQPVLVITGSVDPWCPRRAAEIMLDHLSRATFEELAGVGHLVTDVAAPEFLAVAQPWVNQLEVS